jgi:L-glyceraldehyde 3-phosphate reductase
MTYSPSLSRYGTMEYRRVGKSGLKLPLLSLGLWNNFGDTRPAQSQRSILRRAFDLGITHFDLANNYGPPDGSAETNFGRLFHENLAAHRDEIVISTKAGYYMWPGPYGDWGSRKNLLASLDQSLGRLRLDYVDIFYSHRPDPETPIEETMGALASAVTSGKALYAGISNYYTPEQMFAAAAALAELKVPLLIHQPRYSMFDRRLEDGGLEALDTVGAGSIVFSPLAQGLLTDRYLSGEIPEGSRASEGRWLKPGPIGETYLHRARGLNQIAISRGQTLAQLALTWALRHPQVSSAVIGASSVEQLESNVAVIGAPELTTDELSQIDEFAVHGTTLR